MICEVTSLSHEFINNSMKMRILISKTFGMSTQLSEIISSFWNNIIKKFKYNLSCFSCSKVNIKKHFSLRHINYQKQYKQIQCHELMESFNFNFQFVQFQITNINTQSYRQISIYKKFQIMIFLTNTIKRIFSHTVQLSKEFNQLQRLDIFSQLSKKNVKDKQSSQVLEGFCSKQGTEAFFLKKQFALSKKKLISNPNISISSVGIGTYKGTFSQDDDIKMFNAIIDSVNMGVNVIDTCNNFRAGRSQTAIGLALKYLTQKGNIKRDQLLISSKAGYVRQNLPSKITQNDYINDHCVHPLFLQSCLRSSLEKMNLKSLDVFYLNNFSQCQLQKLGQEEFQKRLCQAFSFCQKAISEKIIKSYGLSSWKSFRVGPKDPLHLNLENIVKLAQKVGGRNHGFRFVQTPINVMMPEAFAQKTQPQGTLLQTAQHLKINIVSNSPLMNGSLINIPLPAHKLKCRNNGAKHLQLIRSIPSQSLVCTLIGQKLNRHVKKNLQVLTAQFLNQKQWVEVFIPSQQAPQIHQGEEDEE